jgi:predicted enzyme related to lactoylglutathione lyase
VPAPPARAERLDSLGRTGKTAYDVDMPIFVNTLTIDARDPLSLARFWSQALDWPIVEQDDEEVMIAPTRERPPAPGVHPLLFARNSDAKTGKNRWHFDLAPEDQRTEVGRLEGLGARRIDIGQGEKSWVVMADPEGNEFCVLRSLSQTPPET